MIDAEKSPEGGIEDKDLVASLERGEPAAIVALYNAYFDRIYASIFHQVNGDHEATQDIVQETFIAALKSVKKFRGESRAYTWLYSIAHKKVIDFYRHKSREARRQTKLGEDLINRQNGHNDGDLPLVSPDSDESCRALQETLAGLPLHYKQVILLKYVEEMPVAEICQVMGRSPKSVEGLLSRARRELKERLGDKDEG